ncbi:hypothetical protein HYH39_02290 [Clostridium botulinum]|nr:hypothetical protein KU40_06960 [Clostridium botulinum]MBY6778055.1 hypothetical protein [Clostridium botulinum]MBY6850957.1 hypothetical protein [Clostridium botulinum]NFF25024.1 hypothetical protein [Clostridium botulinum]NFF37624.1 hypothetical protein [Clostridium botulinum]
MNFKEQIQEDLNNIFFNIDEFGEEHIIDRKVFNVVIDNETLKDRNKKEYDGILQADLLYYIKADDIGELKTNELQYFDGVAYNVFDVKLDNGVYEVILQSNIN